MSYALAELAESNVVGDHDGHDDHEDDKLDVVSIKIDGTESQQQALTIDFQESLVVNSLMMSAR